MDAEAVTEIRRHFDVVAEGLSAKIEQVAEGVLVVDAKLDRVHGSIDADFAEVKPMVKLSFVELDRRVTGLERLVTSLTSRVEKLESSAA